MKHRLVEFLVSEMGFNLFAIEANMTEARRLNEYVLHGKGDPVELIKGMHFWTWSTEEVLEMVKWMRRFNADPANRARDRSIGVTGFDMQKPDFAAEIVRKFVAERAPVLLPKVDTQSGAGGSSPSVGWRRRGI